METPLNLFYLWDLKFDENQLLVYTVCVCRDVNFSVLDLLLPCDFNVSFALIFEGIQP